MALQDEDVQYLRYKLLSRNPQGHNQGSTQAIKAKAKGMQQSDATVVAMLASDFQNLRITIGIVMNLESEDGVPVTGDCRRRLKMEMRLRMENVSEVLTFLMSDELTIEVNQGISNTSVTGAAAVNGQDPTTASSICESTMPEACHSILKLCECQTGA